MHLHLDAELDRTVAISYLGEEVAGTIIWDSLCPDHHVNKVHLSLECRVGQIGCQEEAVNFGKVLFRQEKTVSAPTTEGWRFSFTLPSEWHDRRGSQPLPPSGVFQLNNGSVRIDTTFLSSCDGGPTHGIFDMSRAMAVIYKLKVDSVEGVVAPTNKTMTRHLIVRPCIHSTPCSMPQSDFRFDRILWHDSENKISRLFHRHGHDKPSPDIAIGASITLPAGLWQGQRDSVMLRTLIPSSIPGHTHFSLHTVQIKLMAVTHLDQHAVSRDRNDQPGLQEVGRLTHKMCRQIDAGDSQFELDLGLGLDGLKVLPDYMPSFRSDTYEDGSALIVHEHYLDVLLVLHEQHTGQNHNFEGKHAVKVYPHVFARADYDLAAAINHESEDDRPPPTYKEVMG